MEEEIERMAAEAVDIAKAMKLTLDYSERSIPIVEQVLENVSEHLESLDEDARELSAQRFGCYLLMVGLKTFGGHFLWHEGRDQPVLVVGEPECRVAMITWDKVAGRLKGDKADSIPFFWQGFAQKARAREPGSDVLFV
jgi:hypothetical protein